MKNPTRLVVIVSLIVLGAMLLLATLTRTGDHDRDQTEEGD
ncbi:MAG: hypothetical protein QF652_00650 [Dehalococcoidia bacterium]|jgi:uncharacterized membrane protein YdfJ with MMPL/SSD domain|nr:hypothetical protein [Dehalococcoidia bacterium]